MVENLEIASSETTGIIEAEHCKPKITVFHCFNAVENLTDINKFDCDIKEIRMPCSSITKEVFLLRAFESGADAVVVIACPQGTCRYIEGNIRAGKRVARVKKIMDEIGLDSQCLSIYFIPQGDHAALNDAINQTVNSLLMVEPIPA